MVAFAIAAIVELFLVFLDYKIPDVEFAMFSIVPLLVSAIAINYRTAVIGAAVVSVVVSLLETLPPETLVNPNVWWNALIFYCGYLVALALMRGIQGLASRLRDFLADFNELKAVHDDLLVREFPELGDWEFTVVNVPRRDVGGGFYDLAAWKGGVDLFVGTVLGSPIRAAMVLPALKSLWFGNDVQPPASLRALSRRLAPVLRADVTVRALYGKLYNNGIVRYASAGFPPPFLVTADGSVRRLAGGGASLGTWSTGDLGEAMYMLDGGTALVLANDDFCRLVEEGFIDAGAVIADSDAVSRRIRELPRDGDVVALIARRKTNFLFSHYFEDPLPNADKTVQ